MFRLGLDNYRSRDILSQMYNTFIMLNVTFTMGQREWLGCIPRWMHYKHKNYQKSNV